MDTHVPSLAKFEQHELRKQGYVVLRDFLDDEAVRLVQTASNEMGEQAKGILATARKEGFRLAEYASRFDDQLIVVAEASNTDQVCRYEYIVGSHADLREYFTSTVADAIGALLGEAVVPFKDKNNEKNPGGGGFGPHQDFAAYQAFPPRYNVTAMVAIDPMTQQNGCLHFASNFHELVRDQPGFVKSMIDGQALLHYYDGGEKNGDIRDDIAERLEWRTVEATPLDLVLFDSFIPHYSEPNRSAASRRAMFVTFNARREGTWYEDYYREKRQRYDDPKFHVATPTKHA